VDDVAVSMLGKIVDTKGDWNFERKLAGLANKKLALYCLRKL